MRKVIIVFEPTENYYQTLQSPAALQSVMVSFNLSVLVIGPNFLFRVTLNVLISVVCRCVLELEETKRELTGE